MALGILGSIDGVSLFLARGDAASNVGCQFFTDVVVTSFKGLQKALLNRSAVVLQIIELVQMLIHTRVVIELALSDIDL